ncbi:MAG: signal peptidase II, partial [Pseudomonadota bacterium]
IGNLIDRVVHGYVVDFLYFNYGGWDFPAFNVADTALSIGAALWILSMVLEMRRPAES